MAGHEADILRRAALSRVSGGTVVVDLTRVEGIDGGGIGLLVFLQGWTRAAGMELKLINPSQHVRELLELTNLDSVFQICFSEDAVSCEATVVRATEGKLINVIDKS